MVLCFGERRHLCKCNQDLRKEFSSRFVDFWQYANAFMPIPPATRKRSNSTIPSKIFLSPTEKPTFRLESFIKRLRWKAFFLDTNDEHAEYNNKTFGFKSEATPPQHDGLKYFEQDLYEMFLRIQFRPVKSSFQSQLLADVKTIRKSTSVIVQADKTTNPIPQAT